MQWNSGARTCVEARRAVPVEPWLGLVMMAFALILSPALAVRAPAQDNTAHHRWIVSPSGASVFPTGRFGEKDASSDPKKDGHKTGYSGGLDVGYFLGSHLAVGLALDYSRFPIDFVQPIGQDGHTSVMFGQVWARQFLPGGFAHWRPYILLGAGVGRPKGQVDYLHPVPIDTFSVSGLESSVGIAFGGTGAIGVWIPMGAHIGVLFEPRYRTISTKGTERTDKLRLADGSVVEFKYGSEGNETFRLKAKSNTNWWEIRAGVILTFP